MLYNLKSIIKIMNKKIEYSLKSAYKKIIAKLRLYCYTNLKKVYNGLQENLRNQKNKIANFIIKKDKLYKKKLKKRLFIIIYYNIIFFVPVFIIIRSSIFKPENSY